MIPDMGECLRLVEKAMGPNLEAFQEASHKWGVTRSDLLKMGAQVNSEGEIDHREEYRQTNATALASVFYLKFGSPCDQYAGQDDLHAIKGYE